MIDKLYELVDTWFRNSKELSKVGDVDLYVSYYNYEDELNEDFLNNSIESITNDYNDVAINIRIEIDYTYSVSAYIPIINKNGNLKIIEDEIKICCYEKDKAIDYIPYRPFIDEAITDLVNIINDYLLD